MDENEEEDKGKIAVLHQLTELPLYHIKYHIIISNNPISESISSVEKIVHLSPYK